MEQNSLMLDEEFKDAMDELIPGIKRELSGNGAEEDKEDEIGSYRPSFKLLRKKNLMDGWMTVLMTRSKITRFSMKMNMNSMRVKS